MSAGALLFDKSDVTKCHVALLRRREWPTRNEQSRTAEGSEDLRSEGCRILLSPIYLSPEQLPADRAEYPVIDLVSSLIAHI